MAMDTCYSSGTAFPLLSSPILWPIRKLIQRIFFRYGQGHVLQFWDSLSSVEQLQLVADLETIDLEEMQEMWDQSQDASGLSGIEVSGH